MAPGEHDAGASPVSNDSVRSEPALGAASPAMRAFVRMLTHAAQHGAPVLLAGESGTGKTTFARALHAMSPRAKHPFVRIDCPAGCDDLSVRADAASAGTLFLDEVTELSRATQGSALRLLNEAARRDIRIVASARPDLDVAVADGLFRRDLFYRLSVLEIGIPPLRERPADILPVARTILARLARALRRPTPEMSPALERVLVAYSWPGNVGELSSVLERIVILTPGSSLDVGPLPARMRS